MDDIKEHGSIPFKHIANQRQYVINLKSRGYKLIGSGSFAKVYACEKSKDVIKIGKIKDNKNYLKYINKIKDSNLSSAPKVKAISVKEKFFVVKLEKLVHIKKLSKEQKQNIYNKLNVQKPSDIYENVLGLDGFKEIRKIIYNISNATDIHDDNIMVRKKRNKLQLVITDPLVDGYF